MTNNKMPPIGVELEMEVLGSILFAPDILNRISNVLDVNAFYLESHQVIYRCCLALANSSKPTDPMSVINWLSDNKLLEKVGGKNKIIQIVDSGMLCFNIMAYVEELMNKYLSRQMISVGSNIASMGYDMTQDIQTRLDVAEQEIFAIRNQSSVTSKNLIQTSTNCCAEILQELKELSTGNKISSISTGFYELDKLLGGGVYPGDLIIVAGRPSMGKTIMGASFAFNISLNSKMPTLIFSLEMSAKQINMRYLSGLSGITFEHLRAGKLQQGEWEDFYAAVNILSTLTIFVDDSIEPNALQIRSKVRQIITKHGKLGVIVLDYLQLMVNSAEANVTLKLGEISRQMKLLARECDVPIVCLSQLSRSVEERNNKRPILSDLRQSGQIEENADVVLMIYRDEYYNPKTSDRNIAEVICTKNRNGATGTIQLLADLTNCKFKNLRF
jgi:replicative DNA helicase